MKTENAILMKMARESLKGKWGLAATAYLVFSLIGVINFLPIVGAIVLLVISGPLVLGLTIFSLSISRNKEAKVGQIFEGFNDFGKALGVYFLITIFTILWSLLLIIPGIIAAFSYSMAFFIIADNKEMGAMEAIDKSKEMMKGYKMKLFLLQLRFLGWALLCIPTFGIGFLWLMPYIQVSMAKFYDDLKGEQQVPQVEEAPTPAVA